ncbi:hypothetical protein vseg_006274 [Gypsophila vaccaria]
MEIKKVVVKLSIHDNKDKQKAMKAVTSLSGIDSLDVDLKEGKMTVIGEVDPVAIVSKLRKQWNAQILTVGPAKEEKKGDDKKGGEKKDDGKGGEKKDGGKKDGDKKDDKKDGDKKNEKDQPPVFKPYPYAYPYTYTHPQPHPMYYNVHSIEESPNTCVIC